MQDPIIEEIKDRIDIVDLIGGYIPLKRAGANYKANCPFHGEKTPSFMVNQERQMFRCFGCGEAGDIFAFIQKQESLDFPTALKLLAQKAGVTLPEKHAPPRPQGQPDKPELYQVNNLASQFFHQVLTGHPLGKPTLNYLRSRTVNDESIQKFQIGLAPTRSNTLQAALTKKGIQPAALRLAGSPERFRNRLMFPLRDLLGNTVGFTGRGLLPEQIPKYLNTSDTALFHKNRFLYGLFEAKKAITQENKIILVEGQLDLVLAHQAGTAYTVATSGTALTDDHLKIMRRYTDTLYLALDNDTAGQKATLRAIQLALPHEFAVSVILLEPGSDPGETIAKKPADWLNAVNHPLSATEWLFLHYFPESTRTPSPTEREQILATIFPYIHLQTDIIAQAQSLQHLARLLGITQDNVIQEAFKQWQAKSKTEPKSESSQPKQPESPVEPDNQTNKERTLIGLILIKPDLLDYKEFQLASEDFAHATLSKLYTSIVFWYNKNTDAKTSQNLISYLTSELDARGQKSLEKLLFDTQTYAGEFTPEQFLHEYSTLVAAVRNRLREDRIQSFAKLIAQAEAAGNRAEVLKLMQQMQQNLRPAQQ